MATSPADGFGTGRLFLADSTLAFELLNHARYQALSRFFGVSRQNANVFTVILLVTGANMALERATRIVRAPSGVTRGDAAIGVAALREAVRGTVGPGVADTPRLGTLLTIGIVGGLAAPSLRRAAHAMRVTEHRVREQRIGRYQAAMRAAGPNDARE
jgi:hypothetical protein